MSTTIQQKRSLYALQEVLRINTLPSAKDFAKLVTGLPAMILQNGFGQTLAFLLAKGTKDGKSSHNDKHILAFDLICRWMAGQQLLQETAHSSVMRELSKMEQKDYLTAQQEALKVLEWVKRYANADLRSH